MNKLSISFFISSTFKDFQNERNILQKSIEHKINQYTTEKYGLPFYFVDLRWGINVNSSSNDELLKILQFCADEIKHTEPFFLLFMGNTFGTKIIKSQVEQIYKDYDMTYDNKDKSVTEIEFDLRINGMFNQDQILVFNRHIIVNDSDRSIYFDESQSNIERFKQKIDRIVVEENVIDYHVNVQNEQVKMTNDFKTQVISHIIRVIDNYFESHPLQVKNDYEFKCYQYQMLLSALSKRTIMREDAFDKYHAHAENNRVFVVYGKESCGKTSFLAHLFEELKKENHVIPYLTKQNLLEHDLGNFIDFLRYQFSLFSDLPFHEIKTLTERIEDLYRLAKATDENKNIVVLIDDFDLLSSSNDNYSWLNKRFMPNHIKFIFTVNHMNNRFNLHAYSAMDIELLPFDEKETNLSIKKITNYYHKSLSLELISKLEHKFYQLDDIEPAYVSALLNTLIYLAPTHYKQLNDLIDKHQDYYKALHLIFDYIIKQTPSKIEDFMIYILETVVKDNTRFQYLLALIYLTRYIGFSIDLLQRIDELSEYQLKLPDFIQLKYYLNSFIDINSSDYFVMTNQFVYQSIKKVIDPYIIHEISHEMIMQYAIDENEKYLVPYLYALFELDEYEPYFSVLFTGNIQINQYKILRDIMQWQFNEVDFKNPSSSYLIKILYSLKQIYVLVKFMDHIVIPFLDENISDTNEHYLDLLNLLISFNEKHILETKDIKYKSVFTSYYFKIMASKLRYQLAEHTQLSDFSLTIDKLNKYMTYIDVYVIQTGILVTLHLIAERMGDDEVQRVIDLTNRINQQLSGEISPYDKFQLLAAQIKGKRSLGIVCDQELESIINLFDNHKDNWSFEERLSMLSLIDYEHSEIMKLTYPEIPNREMYHKVLSHLYEGYEFVYSEKALSHNKPYEIQLRANFTMHYALRLYRLYSNMVTTDEQVDEDELQHVYNVSKNSITEIEGIFRHESTVDNAVQFSYANSNHILICLQFFDDLRYKKDIYDCFYNVMLLGLFAFESKNILFEYLLRTYLMVLMFASKCNLKIDLSYIDKIKNMFNEKVASGWQYNPKEIERLIELITNYEENISYELSNDYYKAKEIFFDLLNVRSEN